MFKSDVGSAASDNSDGFLVELRLPSGRLAGGYRARHFLDLANSCEKSGDEELADEIRDAVARDDRYALSAIADVECEDHRG